MLRALVAELLPLKRQVEDLSTQVKQLESRLAKDSHNSHLPPSSDRFVRQPKTKSLRKPSGKKPGAQAGHEGNTLYQVSSPNQIIVHRVKTCACCKHDLSQAPTLSSEHRQVLDLPPKRVVVVEHQAQQEILPILPTDQQGSISRGRRSASPVWPSFCCGGSVSDPTAVIAV